MECGLIRSCLSMDDIISQNAVDHFFQLFALGTALIVFWFLENVWRNNRLWLIAIAIFPLSIFIYIILNFEENRAKCFFAALFFFVMLIIGGIVGHSFFADVINLFKKIAFWPFYLYQYAAPQIAAKL